MKRLYVQIYLTVIASLFLVVLAAGAMWRFAGESGPFAQCMEMAGEVAAAALPPAEAPRDLQQRLRADLALYDGQRGLIASASAPGRIEATDNAGAARRGCGAWAGHDRRGVWHIKLPDGRGLAVRLARDPRGFGSGGWGSRHGWVCWRWWRWP